MLDKTEYYVMEECGDVFLIHDRKECAWKGDAGNSDLEELTQEAERHDKICPFAGRAHAPNQ